MSGTVRRLLAALVVSSAACGPVSPPRPTAPPRPEPVVRTLVLMLDGVPFEVMDSLRRAGLFREFRPPSRVISPFPALTRVAFGSIWHEPPSPGYEDRYFDLVENRVEGGLMDHLFVPAEHAGFQRHVEVRTGELAGGLAYLFPEPVARHELRELRTAVFGRAAYDTTIVAYVVSTDALAHRAGRDALSRFLTELDGLLGEFRSHFGPDFRIILFSDHGNELMPSRRIPLEEVLERAGFHIADRLERDDDVVIPGFGLVGSAFLYSMPAAEARLASALRAAPGVELVVFEDAVGRIHVWSRHGRAIIEGDPGGARMRYAPIEGDPLGLAPALARMQRAGVADARGFAPDSAWLRASLGTPYIDAVRRILVGMRGLVRHTASIVVSFAPGYHYGNRAADLVVDVTGTHGSLRTASALAFLMSTEGQTPAMLRSDQLLEYLPEGVVR
ncbi:MAG TPA: alkaline phosphatase family protein [Longimicrobiales bacterium]